MFTTSVCVSSKDALNSSVFSWRVECLLHQCVCLHTVTNCTNSWRLMIGFSRLHNSTLDWNKTILQYSTVQSTTCNSTETLIKETRKTTRPKQSRMMYSLSINSNFVLVWPWTLTFCVMLRHDAIYCHCEVWFGWKSVLRYLVERYFCDLFQPQVTLTFDLLSDLDLWPPEWPHSWLFHATAPQTTCANLHQNWLICL